MQTDIKPALLTEQEARRYLGGDSRSTIYRLRSDGVIAAVHLGRAVRYRLSDLDRAIETLTDDTGGERC